MLTKWRTVTCGYESRRAPEVRQSGKKIGRWLRAIRFLGLRFRFDFKIVDLSEAKKGGRVAHPPAGGPQFATLADVDLDSLRLDLVNLRQLDGKDAIIESGFGLAALNLGR